jgi:hypothetical protein
MAGDRHGKYISATSLRKLLDEIGQGREVYIRGSSNDTGNLNIFVREEDLRPDEDAWGDPSGLFFIGFIDVIDEELVS